MTRNLQKITVPISSLLSVTVVNLTPGTRLKANFPVRSHLKKGVFKRCPVTDSFDSVLLIPWWGFGEVLL